MSNKYQITVTKEQLKLIANCIEDCHRFISGETEMQNSTMILDNHREVKNKLRELHSVVVPELHKECGYNASYDWAGNGCKNIEQQKFIASTYYIYREILHFLSKDKDNWNVYKSETLRCENSGEPIKIIEL